jgi:rRNA maturation RNase YbeY
VNGSLFIRNRQRAERIDTRFLRRLLCYLLRDELHLHDFELGVQLLGEDAMARANALYLRHAGCTDVITFDYTDPSQPGRLVGDLLVCVPEARRQAPRFGVTWQSELVRYLIHGLLHLRGFDDASTEVRRRMKTEENRLLRRTALVFRLERLSRAGRANRSRRACLSARQSGTRHLKLRCLTPS